MVDLLPYRRGHQVFWLKRFVTAINHYGLCQDLACGLVPSRWQHYGHTCRREQK